MQFLLLAAFFLLPNVNAQSPVSSALMTAAIDLLDGNHILHFLEVIDAFGHISLRNPDNSSQFILSFSKAPALTTSKTLVTYEIVGANPLQLTFDSSVTGSNIPTSFSERFIHSQIYKAFPEVMGVVHSHTIDVLPFAGSNVPLRAQIHTSGSVGTIGTPIFDYTALPPDILPADQPHNFRIGNAVLGDALVSAFTNSSQIVLMKNHGMAVRAPSLRDAVFRAFYTKQDATVQLQTILLGGDLDTSGLTPQEATDSINSTEADTQLARAWELWVAQVDNAGLYKNDLRNGGDPPFPGA